jgi:hypothetical protein
MPVLQTITEVAVALLLWATLLVAVLMPPVILLVLWLDFQRKKRAQDDDDISSGGGWQDVPINRPPGGPRKARTVEEVLLSAIGNRAPVEVEMPEEVCV